MAELLATWFGRLTSTIGLASQFQTLVLDRSFVTLCSPSAKLRLFDLLQDVCKHLVTSWNQVAKLKLAKTLVGRIRPFSYVSLCFRSCSVWPMVLYEIWAEPWAIFRLG